MRFAVIGVGGVGGYFGGLLARSGNEVVFVARGEQYEALSSRGLEVKSVDGTFKVSPVRVYDSVEALAAAKGRSHFDVILVATKTYDRDHVADALGPVVTPETVVLPLLNGIDNDLQMKARMPECQIHPGLCYIISARVSPGVIEQSAGPRTLFFGDRTGAENPRLKKLESVLRNAGILATASSEIQEELWRKFLWITAFAGMTSLCRSSIGTIVNDRRGFQLLTQCLDEGIAVALACGVAIDQGERAAILQKAEAYRQTGSHAKSSMLVDLEHLRPTEIEALNGTLVRLAREHGLTAPLHEIIYEAVRLGALEYTSG